MAAIECAWVCLAVAGPRRVRLSAICRRAREDRWLMATCTGVVAVAAAVESIWSAQTSGIDGRKCGAPAPSGRTPSARVSLSLSLWYTTSTTTTRAIDACIRQRAAVQLMPCLNGSHASSCSHHASPPTLILKPRQQFRRGPCTRSLRRPVDRSDAHPFGPAHHSVIHNSDIPTRHSSTTMPT